MFTFHYVNMWGIPGCFLDDSLDSGLKHCEDMGYSYHRIETPQGNVLFDAKTLSALI